MRSSLICSKKCLRLCSGKSGRAKRVELDYLGVFLIRTDLFVLRRFQSLSDLLSPIVGCYTISWFFLVLSVPNLVLVVLAPQSLSAHFFNAFASLVWGSKIRPRFKKINSMFEVYNQFPIAAVLEFPLRLVVGFLIITLGLVSLSFSRFVSISLVQIFQILFFILLYIHLYFSACIQIRPPPKPTTEFSPAL